MYASRVRDGHIQREYIDLIRSSEAEGNPYTPVQMQGSISAAADLLRNQYDIPRYAPVRLSAMPTWSEDPYSADYWRLSNSTRCTHLLTFSMPSVPPGMTFTHVSSLLWT